MPKRFIKRNVLKLINSSGVSSKFIGTPKGTIYTKQWCWQNGCNYLKLDDLKYIEERPPFYINGNENILFTQEYTRLQKETFVAEIPNGRVWGRYGAVITPDDILLEDVSREFGKYKGVYGQGHAVFNRFSLGLPNRIKGNVAVISTTGCNNYYHWMIDVLPRLKFLKLSGHFDNINFFVLDYEGYPYQRESLHKAGVKEEQVIRSNSEWRFHIIADNLIVPSLASELSIVNHCQVEFLNEIFSSKKQTGSQKSTKLFIGRKKADSRRLINESEVLSFLEQSGYIAFYPEEHTIEYTAAIMRTASDVISVHGAGNTNWVFCNEKTKLTELFLSTQIYPNFWTLANRINATYSYIASNHEFLDNSLDPVVNKQSSDFVIDIKDLASIV